MQTTRVRSLTLVAAMVFAGITGTTGIAEAQLNSDVANVTAVVQQPITVTAQQDLDFGDVFPGVNKTIDATDATAARFDIVGQNSAQVHLTFTLPTELTNTTSGGSETMPLGTTWTGITNTTASQSGGTNFTPSASPTTSTLSSTGALYVYVGGSVEPDAGQVAGTYTGTLTLTVVYF